MYSELQHRGRDASAALTADPVGSACSRSTASVIKRQHTVSTGAIHHARDPSSRSAASASLRDRALSTVERATADSGFRRVRPDQPAARDPPPTVGSTSAQLTDYRRPHDAPAPRPAAPARPSATRSSSRQPTLDLSAAEIARRPARPPRCPSRPCEHASAAAPPPPRTLIQACRSSPSQPVTAIAR